MILLTVMEICTAMLYIFQIHTLHIGQIAMQLLLVKVIVIMLKEIWILRLLNPLCYELCGLKAAVSVAQIRYVG